MDAPTTFPPLPDPIALIRQLDPDVISARLEAMERERRALLVLLRAARASHPHAAREKGAVTRG